MNEEQKGRILALIQLCLNLNKRELKNSRGFILSSKLPPKEHIKKEIKELLDIDIEWEW